MFDDPEPQTHTNKSNRPGPCHQGSVEFKLGIVGAQSGYVSKEKRGTPHVPTAKRTHSSPITLTPSPAFTCNGSSIMINFVQMSCNWSCLCLLWMTHHVHDADVSISIHNSIGRIRHWQQEREGCAECGWDKDVKWIHVDSLCLKLKTVTNI